MAFPHHVQTCMDILAQGTDNDLHGCFMNMHPENPSVAFALLIGPSNSHVGGFFMFEIAAPPNYPQVPPQFTLITTGPSTRLLRQENSTTLELPLLPISQDNPRLIVQWLKVVKEQFHVLGVSTSTADPQRAAVLSYLRHETWRWAVCNVLEGKYQSPALAIFRNKTEPEFFKYYKVYCEKAEALGASKNGQPLSRGLGVPPVEPGALFRCDEILLRYEAIYTALLRQGGTHISQPPPTTAVQLAALVASGFSYDKQVAAMRRFSSSGLAVNSGQVNQTMFVNVLGVFADATLVQRLFTAFMNASGSIDIREFFVAVATNDPAATTRDAGSETSQWTPVQCGFFFTVYDLDRDGQISADEFRLMISHMLIHRFAAMPPESIRAIADRAMQGPGGSMPQTLNREQCTRACRQLQFSTVMVLCKASPPTSPRVPPGPFGQPASTTLRPPSPSSPLRPPSPSAPSAFPRFSFVSPPTDVEDFLPPLRETSLSVGGQAFPVQIRPKVVYEVLGRDESIQMQASDDAQQKLTALTAGLMRESSTAFASARSPEALANRIIQLLLPPRNRNVEEFVASLPNQWGPASGMLNFVECMEFLGHVKSAFASQNMLEEVPAPCKVFGDIHGQFSDLLRWFEKYGQPDHRTGDVMFCNYVFLGDYVDRGPRIVECVFLLFALMIRYPKRVILIRGNHEDRTMNVDGGTKEACFNVFGMNGEAIWTAMNDCFDWMPVAVLMGGQILGLHGGLGKDLSSLHQIRSLPRPLVSVDANQPLALDILWSDPTDHDTVLGVWENHHRGGETKVFGPDRVLSFCANNGIKMIIRAHECVEDGYQFFAGGYCITVFSAPGYKAEVDNDGAMIELIPDRSRVNNITISVKTLHPSDPVLHASRREKRAARERMYPF